MSIVVTTQEELDTAIGGGAEGIVIDSLPTVWLVICGGVSAETRGHSRVTVWDTSHVKARDWSAVQAWDYSHVDAGPRVTVHRRSTTATVTGGNNIDITTLNLSDPTAWTAYHGVTTKGGAATVYKAVSQELVAGQGRIPTTYPIGSTVEATDWDPIPECGHGLHFSPTPSQALPYYQGLGKPRLLACEVDVTSLVPLGDKCKAPSCRVLREVDIHADPIDAADIQKEGVA